MSACSCCCCCCWQQVSSIQQERAGTEGLVAQLGKQAAALEAWLSNHEWKADAVAATTADGSNALDINKARLFAELIALLSAGLHVVCCYIEHRMPPSDCLGYCRALTAVRLAMYSRQCAAVLVEGIPAEVQEVLPSLGLCAKLRPVMQRGLGGGGLWVSLLCK
jgi:hypothetical protein